MLQLGDWLVTYFDPIDYWKAHKSYVLCEIIFVVGGLLAFAHGKHVPRPTKIRQKIIIFFQLIAAFKQGGRWPWLVVAATTHGFFLENVAYFAPFIENFWHAQGIVTFLDRRMPLYIVFLCEHRNDDNCVTANALTHIFFRYRLLLSGIVGDVEDAFKKSFCRMHGRWIDDGPNRYAL